MNGGTVDRIAGRILEAVGKLTRKQSTRAKGSAARGRGAAKKGGKRASRR
jgi:uncharacterized protein YjbJ (UPF0337 family)